MSDTATRKYKCVKEFSLDKYDEDGFYDDTEPLVIKVGDTYEYNEDCQDLIIANKPAVHLDLIHSSIHHWIEIYPETLAEYFEEIKE